MEISIRNRNGGRRRGSKPDPPPFPEARSGVSSGSQGFSVLSPVFSYKGWGPRFPNFLGALARSRALLGVLAWIFQRPEGPRTGQEGPKIRPRGPKMLPRRQKSAPRHPRWPHDGPGGFQEAPRALQEASQEGSKRPKSSIVIMFFNVFGVLAFSCFRRSKTDHEARKTAPRRPKRPPRGP